MADGNVRELLDLSDFGLGDDPLSALVAGLVPDGEGPSAGVPMVDLALMGPDDIFMGFGGDQVLMPLGSSNADSTLAASVPSSFGGDQVTLSLESNNVSSTVPASLPSASSSGDSGSEMSQDATPAKRARVDQTSPTSRASSKVIIREHLTVGLGRGCGVLKNE